MSISSPGEGVVPGLSTSAQPTQSFVVGNCPAYWRMFCRIPGSLPLDTSSIFITTSQAVTTTGIVNVPWGVSAKPALAENHCRQRALPAPPVGAESGSLTFPILKFVSPATSRQNTFTRVQTGLTSIFTQHHWQYFKKVVMIRMTVVGNYIYLQNAQT